MSVVWKTAAGLSVGRHVAGSGPSDWRVELVRAGSVRDVASTVVTPDGETIVAFQPVRSDGTVSVDVVQAGRHEAFGAPVTVSPPSPYRSWPRLTVMPFGDVAMAFVERTTALRGSLRVAMWTSDTRHFSVPRTVALASQPPSIVTADTGAIVTWRSALHRSRAFRGFRRDLLALRIDGRGRPAGARSVLTRDARSWNSGAGVAGRGAVVAWPAIDRRTSRDDLVLACRLTGTPLRCRRRATFSRVANTGDVAQLAVSSRGDAVIGLAMTPPEGGALPVFATMSRRGIWSPLRSLSDPPTAGGRRLVVAPDVDTGFLAIAERDGELAAFHVSERAAVGPGQSVGEAGDDLEAVATGDRRTTVAAWTTNGRGTTGPVNVALIER